MLDGLSGRDQSDIKSARTPVVFHYFRTLVGDADNSVAGFSLTFFLDCGEYLFESFNVALGLGAVLCELE